MNNDGLELPCCECKYKEGQLKNIEVWKQGCINCNTSKEHYDGFEKQAILGGK